MSTEITGYAVSAHLFFHEESGEEAHLEAARTAGEFLLGVWDEASATMPFECGPTGNEPGQLAYFFDCGIIGRGFLRLWRRTGEAKYLGAAIRMGETMARDFQNGADIHPVLTLPEKKAAERDRRWSRQSDCYQLKAALAWLELAEATGDDEYRRAFQTTLRRALQSEAGFLTGEGEGTRVMDRLHAFGYFLEGLLSQGTACRATLEGGIERAAAWLRRIRPEFERSDASAQLVRVRLCAEVLGEIPLDEKAAAEEAEWAASFQDPSGAFWFGRTATGLLPFHNPVSTAFCAQALEMWRRRCERGPDTINWRDVI